jgi:hypothetical protein
VARMRDTGGMEAVPALDPLARHTLSALEIKEMLAAERTGAPFLAFRDERGALRLLALGEGERRSTIGRRRATDIPLAWDGQVSGLHAELECVAGEWLIFDDGLSRNGTYVNQQRLRGRQRLRDGDRIRIGCTVLVYRSPHSLIAEASTLEASQLRAELRLTDSERSVLVALCRPYSEHSEVAAPATNQQIADEVFLSVNTVKMHLGTLFKRFELSGLPQNQKRTRLAAQALALGIVTDRDLA